VVKKKILCFERVAVQKLRRISTVFLKAFPSKLYRPSTASEVTLRTMCSKTGKITLKSTSRRLDRSQI